MHPKSSLRAGFPLSRGHVSIYLRESTFPDCYNVISVLALGSSSTVTFNRTLHISFDSNLRTCFAPCKVKLVCPLLSKLVLHIF